MTDTVRTSTHLVDPVTLKGFRDYLPQDLISRNKVIEKIRGIFEKYGFMPIDTPILEYLTTLIGTGGEETNKQLFRLESPENEPVAMRFDLTVPFARIIAQYPEKVKLPFRRYHIGPVFRADKPGPGRYRQFTQFDIDTAGTESLAADAEIISAVCEVFRTLGLHNNGSEIEYCIRINNRKLIDSLLENCDINEVPVQKHVLRVVDKLLKVGIENVRKELGSGRIDDSGDPIPGVHLKSNAIDKILEFISIKAGSRSGIIEELEKQIGSTESGVSAINGMKELAECLDSLGVSESEAVYDPSLARGLDYYTGPVFEAFCPKVPEFGSVMGGGRYDHLVERFLDGRIPATGVSIGIDRFIAALSAMGRMDTETTISRVIVLAMKGVPYPELLKVASEIRSGGIPAEIYMGEAGTSIKNQLSYANFREIPVAVIIGPDELKEGKASVKDLISGKEKRTCIGDREEYVKAGKTGQVTVNRNELIKTIHEIIDGGK